MKAWVELVLTSVMVALVVSGVAAAAVIIVHDPEPTYVVCGKDGQEDDYVVDLYVEGGEWRVTCHRDLDH